MRCPNCGHEVKTKRKGKPWPAGKKAEFRRAYKEAQRKGASHTQAFKKGIQAVKGW